MLKMVEVFSAGVVDVVWDFGEYYGTKHQQFVFDIAEWDLEISSVELFRKYVPFPFMATKHYWSASVTIKGETGIIEEFEVNAIDIEIAETELQLLRENEDL